jgi:predicted nucleotidyltransferase component of viral defense system
MKDHLLHLINTAKNPLLRKNLVREYLQARILEHLQRTGGMIYLAFHGGTALRFLYDIARYSEDLDFALERPQKGYDIRRFLRAIQSALGKEGYDIQIRINDQKIIHTAYLRFQGLLHELELSPHTGEVLSIKLEVDTHPPAGAVLETTLVHRHIPLRLQHHDRASLLAGKLHAFLQREHTKGRDLYDLMWYLGNPRWPAPNLDLLVNALDQTGWKGQKLTSDNWQRLIFKQLEHLDWAKVRADVLPYLERAEEIDLLTLDQFTHLSGFGGKV